MSIKIDRQNLISQIVQSKPMGSIEDVLCELEKRNEPSSKATVARDIKDLDLIKVGGKYVFSDKKVIEKSEDYLKFLISQNDILWKRPKTPRFMVIYTDGIEEDLFADLLSQVFIDVSDYFGVIPGKGFVLVITGSKKSMKKIQDFINSSSPTKTAIEESPEVNEVSSKEDELPNLN